MSVTVRSFFSRFFYCFLFSAVMFFAVPAVSPDAQAANISQPSAGATQMKAAVTQLSGKVLVLPAGANTWRDAKPGEFLGTGDKIETKDNGLVELTLENETVIYLKPGTNLTLTVLTFDQKTGGYVNQFYSDLGKIRAKVEKMGPRSTFEVKTPTAVAAVRGTIVFLNITRSRTRAAFFDGIGYVTNPLSGRTETVGDGEETSSDTDGNLSAPEGVSDETYNDADSGWEPGEDRGDNGGTEDSTDNEQPDEPQRPEGSRFDP